MTARACCWCWRFAGAAVRRGGDERSKSFLRLLGPFLTGLNGERERGGLSGSFGTLSHPKGLPRRRRTTAEPKLQGHFRGFLGPFPVKLNGEDERGCWRLPFGGGGAPNRRGTTTIVVTGDERGGC
ncbi:hypothetical protein V6N12_047782 [Hibiscus sabdariffa]|uniref:Secreted protein n=1 Tax=Hibiscus sabdariffa TaxID=183260 RepID=A0ABR2CU05_9ROSI